MNKTLRAIFLSSRPISWINTAFPFAAGYFLVTRQADLYLIIGTLFFLIPYNLMMYGVNDVFDYESDIRNPRKGGIEGAKLTRRYHRPILIAVAVTVVPFALAMFTWGDTAARLTLAFVLFTVLAYSVPKLRFKERPFIDSLTSSAHFTGPLVYGLVLAGWQPGYWPYVVAFFFWGMASHAFGAVQDVIADREGGLSSIATVFGARFTTRFAVLLYAAAGLVLLTQGLAAAICGLTAIFYIVNILPHWNITDATCEQANKAWRRFIWTNMLAGAVITNVLILVYRSVL